MKNLIRYILFIAIIAIVVINLDIISNFLYGLLNVTPKVVIDNPNIYAYNNDYVFIKKSNDFVPYSKQDLTDIFYTILNNGYDNFTFYCPKEYNKCLEDVEQISKDTTLLTTIGNYIHPYNNFLNIKVMTDSLGEVNVVVEKLYTDEMIDYINNEVDKIFSNNLNNTVSLEDKILKLHNYIIDYTSYDEQDEFEDSGNAYGLLKNKKAKCSGYADIMSIMLAKLNVQNIKISSKEHIWNLVYLNDEWLHLDLTWDDPIVKNNVNITDNIRHKFYLIDTDALLSYDTNEHNFDAKKYILLKKD